jgi:hypothetical protein
MTLIEKRVPAHKVDLVFDHVDRTPLQFKRITGLRRRVAGGHALLWAGRYLRRGF